jgi:hypothetical protein
MKVFRQSVIFLLIFCTLTANCTHFFVIAGLELNRNYIATNLCINKSRPWMHCNGKCYFMKKIQQAAENEKKQEAKDNQNCRQVSFFQETFRLSFIEPAILETVKSTFATHTYQYSSRFIESIFRPPKRKLLNSILF